MYCKESTHYLPLRVCQEIHPTKTLFECPFCATPKPPLHNDGDHVRIPIESLKYAPPEVGEWIFYMSDSDEQVVHDPPTVGTSGHCRPPGARGPQTFPEPFPVNGECVVNKKEI
ncbi:hypothetical protein RHGRI_000341 [Rhododendron griersonianum]|uniref:Uncharacterized protein n=1 Tax=Rhododendron griersonianum TaxID=479676 RepID=A0AAV6LH53_9ERIC|nr:hypothetical protein RHGRI_000341 [Rhododendron griersonianum]